ncbi:SET domain-containing protein [Aquabacterium sp.]|uniref:SET domain-containing protein n=1 Tax=Aquabacterium sp. TaxID=1872578 RepID=UPI0035B3C647
MPTLKPLTPAAPAAAPASADAPRGVPADPQKFPVDVRPSAIDGLGAFALTDIPAQRKIGEIRGEPVSLAESQRRARAQIRQHQSAGTPARITIIAVSGQRAIDATESTDPLRYANHSCAPNMVLKVQQGRVAFYALRDIAAGEELTARYGATHHAGQLTCRCGAPGCRGAL